MASSIKIRKSDEVVDVVPLGDVRLRMFDAAVPWRVFRWYRKQRHFSGSYWSATMGALSATSRGLSTRICCWRTSIPGWTGSCRSRSWSRVRIVAGSAGIFRTI